MAGENTGVSGTTAVAAMREHLIGQPVLFYDYKHLHRLRGRAGVINGLSKDGHVHVTVCHDSNLDVQQWTAAQVMPHNNVPLWTHPPAEGVPFDTGCVLVAWFPQPNPSDLKAFGTAPPKKV